MNSPIISSKISNEQPERPAAALKWIALSPVKAVCRFMKSPSPLLLSVTFVFIAAVLSSLLLPSIISGTQDTLQSSGLTEHLTPEEMASITRLSPLRRAFGSVLMASISYFSVLFQGFFIYLFFAVAHYPGYYREYLSACLVISFYDTILPMFLSLVFPFIPFAALNLAAVLPKTSPLLLAFLQPTDLFFFISLLLLGAGTIRFSNQKPSKTWKVLLYYLIARTLFFGSLNLFFH